MIFEFLGNPEAHMMGLLVGTVILLAILVILLGYNLIRIMATDKYLRDR
jgi:hypothetical protein